MASDTWSTVLFVLAALAFKVAHFALSSWISYRRCGGAREIRVKFGLAQKARQKSEADGRPRKAVLVTGGCGLLGRHIVALLVERFPELDVAVLDAGIRSPHPDVTYYQGDVRVASHVKAAANGAAAVIHCAGMMQGATTDLILMRDVEVKGTMNVLETCLDREIRVLVYTSSVAVHYTRLGLGLTRVGEEEPLPEDSHMLLEYGSFKRVGERMVLAANSHLIRTTVLRPGTLLSADDQGVVDWGMSGAIAPPGCADKRLPCCWVNDAARAHVTALIRLLMPGDMEAAGRAAEPWFGAPSTSKQPSIQHGRAGAQEVPGAGDGGADTPLVFEGPVAGQVFQLCFDPDVGLPTQDQLKDLVVRKLTTRWTACLLMLLQALPLWAFNAVVNANENCAKTMSLALHDGLTKAALRFASRDGDFAIGRATKALGWHPRPWHEVALRLGGPLDGAPDAIGSRLSAKKAQ